MTLTEAARPARPAALFLFRIAWLLGMALAGVGCAVQTQALRIERPAGLAPQAELGTTPFFAQTEYHCGPAALATVLGAAGIAAPPADLGAQVFLPARTGTLQIEMIAGARRQGAVATRLPPSLDSVLREVQAGHPVVVLLNLGLSWYPRWHYAVLVGYDLDAGDVLLRSGTTERLVMAMRSFEHTWQRAGAWAFTALPPGHWPATAQEVAVVDAAVGFERAATPPQAALVYRSALQRWAGNLSLQMGLGNSLHASGDRRAAAQAFRAATLAHPASTPAWINLASTLIELDELDQASQAARQALATADAAWRMQAEAVAARVPGPQPR